MKFRKLISYISISIAPILLSTIVLASQKTTLYMASALFNAREARFNLAITSEMEQRGYRTILPQRDGFEYTFLSKITNTTLPKSEAFIAARDLIYLLDMGVFIPTSDVIVANLDEPVDDGVIIEIAYAHMIGKPIICYRTDVRQPFGSYEGLSGIHSFVAFQCDYLVLAHMASESANNANETLATLTRKIDTYIQALNLTTHRQTPEYVKTNPQLYNITSLAKLIIPNPKEIHDKAELDKIVKRLLENREKFQKLHIGVDVVRAI